MSLDLPRSATYNGTSLNTDVSGQHRIMLFCVRGIDDLWEVRGTDVTIPSASGKTPQDRKRDFLTIELRGWLYGTGSTDDAQRADMQAIIDELRDLFDPENDPATLSVVGLDGANRRISARPQNMVTLQMPEWTAREVSIELLAVEGDWSRDLDLPLNQQLGTTFPMTIA